MDGAQVSYPYPAVGSSGLTRRVGGRGGGRAASGASLGEAATRVQILVVVANIQTRTLKTEVEKGSM